MIYFVILSITGIYFASRPGIFTERLRLSISVVAGVSFFVFFLFSSHYTFDNHYIYDFMSIKAAALVFLLAEAIVTHPDEDVPLKSKLKWVLLLAFLILFVYQLKVSFGQTESIEQYLTK
jgi:hypothetical protein